MQNAASGCGLVLGGAKGSFLILLLVHVLGEVFPQVRARSNRSVLVEESCVCDRSKEKRWLYSYFQNPCQESCSEICQRCTHLCRLHASGERSIHDLPESPHVREALC